MSFAYPLALFALPALLLLVLATRRRKPRVELTIGTYATWQQVLGREPPPSRRRLPRLPPELLAALCLVFAAAGPRGPTPATARMTLLLDRSPSLGTETAAGPTRATVLLERARDLVREASTEAQVEVMLPTTGGGVRSFAGTRGEVDAHLRELLDTPLADQTLDPAAGVLRLAEAAAEGRRAIYLGDHRPPLASLLEARGGGIVLVGEPTEGAGIVHFGLGVRAAGSGLAGEPWVGGEIWSTTRDPGRLKVRLDAGGRELDVTSEVTGWEPFGDRGLVGRLQIPLGEPAGGVALSVSLEGDRFPADDRVEWRPRSLRADPRVRDLKGGEPLLAALEALGWSRAGEPATEGREPQLHLVFDERTGGGVEADPRPTTTIWVTDPRQCTVEVEAGALRLAADAPGTLVATLAGVHVSAVRVRPPVPGEIPMLLRGDQTLISRDTRGNVRLLYDLATASALHRDPAGAWPSLVAWLGEEAGWPMPGMTPSSLLDLAASRRATEASPYEHRGAMKEEGTRDLTLVPLLVALGALALAELRRRAGS